MGVRQPLYRTDLAFVQAAGFSGDQRRSAPGLLALLRRAGIRSGTVVDLGSGAGFWLRALSDAGFQAVGCDASGPLVKIARRNAPAASIKAASVDRFPIPPCDAITALGEVLCYRPPRHALRDLDGLFRRVAAALRPGGLLVFDAMVRERGAPMAYRTWTEGPGWAVLVDVVENRVDRSLTRDIITFRLIDGRYRRSREVHQLTVFDPADLGRALRRAGFAVATTPRIGGVALAPRRLGFIATLPHGSKR